MSKLSRAVFLTLALWTGLCLALPNPSWALRSIQSRQNPEMVRDLSAGLEEVPITVQGPDGPITWSAPKLLAGVHQRISSYNPTADQVVEAVHEMSSRLKPDQALLAHLEETGNHPGIRFWILQHLYDPAFALTGEEKSRIEREFRVALMFEDWFYMGDEMAHIPSQEMSWYLLVNLLVMEERLSQPSKRAPSDAQVDYLERQTELIYAAYDALLERLSVAGEHWEQHPSEFFEPRLMNLARSQPSLNEPVSQLLQRFKKQVRVMDEGEFFMRQIFRSATKDEAKAPYIPSEKELEKRAVDQRWVQQKLQELTDILAPKGDHLLERAWYQPLEFLAETCKGADAVMLESHIEIRAAPWVQGGVPAPNWWHFQLAWLDRMTRVGFKRWAITNAPSYAVEIQQWANSKGDTRTLRQFLELLQEFLDSKGRISLRNFLGTAYSDETSGVAQSIQFWERLWELKRLHKAELIVFPMDLAGEARRSKDWQRFRLWRTKGAGQLILSSGGHWYLGGGIRRKFTAAEKKSLVQIQQLHAHQHYYAPDHVFGTAFSLPYAAYEVGKRDGWGSSGKSELESWQASAVPVRNNEALREFFKRPDASGSKERRRIWTSQKKEFQERTGGPFDVLIFSNPPGDDGDSGEEIWTPTPEDAGVRPGPRELVPVGPRGSKTAGLEELTPQEQEIRRRLQTILTFSIQLTDAWLKIKEADRPPFSQVARSIFRTDRLVGSGLAQTTLRLEDLTYLYWSTGGPPAVPTLSRKQEFLFSLVGAVALQLSMRLDLGSAITDRSITDHFLFKATLDELARGLFQEDPSNLFDERATLDLIRRIREVAGLATLRVPNPRKEAVHLSLWEGVELLKRALQEGDSEPILHIYDKATYLEPPSIDVAKHSDRILSPSGISFERFWGPGTFFVVGDNGEVAFILDSGLPDREPFSDLRNFQEVTADDLLPPKEPAGLEEEKIPLAPAVTASKVIFIMPEMASPRLFKSLRAFKPAPGEQLQLVVFAEHAFHAEEIEGWLNQAGLAALEIVNVQREIEQHTAEHPDWNLFDVVAAKQVEYYLGTGTDIHTVWFFEDLKNLGRFLGVAPSHVQLWEKSLERQFGTQA